MESTGFPLRIHCSQRCKGLLERLGGYRLEERGEVAMKGKGTMVTYWLEGEEPALRAARSRKHHTLYFGVGVKSIM